MFLVLLHFAIHRSCQRKLRDLLHPECEPWLERRDEGGIGELGEPDVTLRVPAV